MEWTNSPLRHAAGTKRAAEHDAPNQPLMKRLERLTIRPPPPRPRPPPSQRMDLDTAPHVVYIDSLSDSDSETESDSIVFLPDVEKKLFAIPAHILSPPTLAPTAAASNALVLYTVPRSLSVAEEQEDGVRRVIVEARARIRRKKEEDEKKGRVNAPGGFSYYGGVEEQLLREEEMAVGQLAREEEMAVEQLPDEEEMAVEQLPREEEMAVEQQAPTDAVYDPDAMDIE